jgi:hypothetical protein
MELALLGGEVGCYPTGLGCPTARCRGNAGEAGPDAPARRGLVGVAIERRRGGGAPVPQPVGAAPEAHDLGVRGAHGEPVCRTIGPRYLRKLKLDDGRRIVMPSARHTVADKLRESGTQDSVISAILGHAHQSMTGRMVAGRRRRSEAVESIRH